MESKKLQSVPSEIEMHLVSHCNATVSRLELVSDQCPSIFDWTLDCYSGTLVGFHINDMESKSETSDLVLNKKLIAAAIIIDN